MKTLISTILLTCCGLTAFAQQELIHPKERAKQVMVSSDHTQPYVLVNDQETKQGALVISPQSIESVNVYKDANATARFGDKAKDGAIVLHTKPGVQLARLADIYTYFEVPVAQQHLKVVIGNQLIKNTDLILAELEEIERVEVVKQDIVAPVRWSLNEEEEFLKITPKQPAKQ
ncbi:hypothetical protein [Pontibacter roseus]|uniref:hypothetical protein n=1 Tax=Pontibacter roseus TaxID=336989 RepID=UPI00035E817D|nr:hypothetical protein [Pontibacter roseus]